MTAHIDDVTRDLIGWLAEVTGLAVQADGSGADGVSVRLAQVTPSARPRDAGEALSLTLRYRITLQVADPFAAQRALGELVFAAIPHPRYEIATEEATSIPTVLITTSLRRERLRMAAPTVRHPLRIDAGIRKNPDLVETTQTASSARR